jgi:hypothetical protein
MVQSCILLRVRVCNPNLPFYIVDSAITRTRRCYHINSWVQVTDLNPPEESLRSNAEHWNEQKHSFAL